MKEKQRKINKVTFFYLFALIVFLEPQGFKEVESAFYSMDYIYKILKLAIGTIIVLSYIYSKKSKVLSDKFIFSVFLFEIFMLLSTIINNGDLVRFTGPAITVVAMAILSKYIIEEEKLYVTVKVLNKYFLLCFFINLITMFFINKNGTGINFLGIDNRLIWTFFPWMICAGIESLFECGKFNKKYFITFILTESILIYTWSVSAMLAMLLFLLPPILKKLNINYKLISVINVIVNYAITNFKLYKIDWIRYFVVEKLNKDITYSGRTFLWSEVYEAIKYNPFLGCGTQSIENDKEFFFLSSGTDKFEFLRVIHAHNSFMTILYRGGLASLFIYILIIFMSLKKLSENKNNILSPLFLFGITIILILSLFDTIDFAFLFFCYGLCYYIEKIKI